MPDMLESVEGGVAVLTLNRPESRNALSTEMLTLLNESLQRLAVDPAIGAVVVTGADGAFCAGGDVKGFAASEGGANHGASLEQAALRLRTSMECSRLLHEMPKITIAAIPGAAAGAGLSIALACDFRIAAKTAKITTAFAKVGLSGDFGGTYFLSRLVGGAKARELYLLSDVILGEEAERLGVVNRAVDADALMPEAMKLAHRLANGPRITLGLIKKNLNIAEAGDLIRSFDAEAAHHSRCATTEDHREAARAFVEKRAPVFKGN
ncbi:enoyl-CoA hydratase [bacterium]|nr:enoyl-CoA hydratase [bacterium]